MKPPAPLQQTKDRSLKKAGKEKGMGCSGLPSCWGLRPGGLKGS